MTRQEKTHDGDENDDDPARRKEMERVASYSSLNFTERIEKGSSLPYDRRIFMFYINNPLSEKAFEGDLGSSMVFTRYHY